LAGGVGGKAPYVDVCIDGHGPYSFLLDTGAPMSMVDTALAQALKLPAATPATRPVGIGCVSASQEAVIERWSMGEVPLSGQSVLTADIPGFGLSGAPAGVLGGDVLSRFGALRIDYRRLQVTVLAPEAPAPINATILRAVPDFQEPPPLLVRGTPTAAYLTVLRTSDSSLVTTAAVFGGHSAVQFTVDTGAATTTVSPALARESGLGRTSATGGQSQPNVGCHSSAPDIQSGSWSIGGVGLSARRLTATTLSGANQTSGSLGSDVLSGYGSVVIDYRTGVLWLGAS
jgi:hypothetical protein